MPLTAAERAQRYHEKLKENQGKYAEHKHRDRQRKLRQRLSLTNKRKEIHLANHRKAQQYYRERLKEKKGDQSLPGSYRTKQTLAKAVRKVVQALPDDRHRRQRVLERLTQDFYSLPKGKAKRTQPQIPDSVLVKIKEFYQKDFISWQAPGKRDFVTVKENGMNVKYQKRHLLYNLREVYELFKELNPNMSIGRSTFAKLRHMHVLHQRTLAHRGCLCITHENVHLLLIALVKEIDGSSDHLDDYTRQVVCDESDEACMMSNCDECKDSFNNIIAENIKDETKTVEWFQWVNCRGRAVKKLFSGTVLQCVQQLREKTPHYLSHVFVKRKQSSYFEHIKETAGDHTAVCQVDYAENFTLTNQDQIQSAYWSQKQVSIFTAYVWMDGSGGQGQSFGLVSNGTTHDKFTVITCLEIMIKEVISIMPDVNEIVFFSDGAASRFKNRYLLQHLTMMMEANDLEISWNYFASSHGKGVVDGVGGTLKRLVWTEIIAGARCSSAQEFVGICHRKKTATTVGFVQQAQFDATQVSLERTFQTIPGIPGIQRQNHINVLHMNVIEYARYSTSDDKCVFRF